MSTRFYDTDLADAAWSWVAPVLPAARPGGRPRTTDLRAVLNAIFYLLRTGCQWRLLPREFPPWGTVYHYFRLWRTTSVWVHLYHGDREKPVTRLSSACSQAKFGLDLQAWIGGLLKGQPPTPGPKTLACGHAAP